MGKENRERDRRVKEIMNRRSEGGGVIGKRGQGGGLGECVGVRVKRLEEQVIPVWICDHKGEGTFNGKRITVFSLAVFP